MYIRAHICGLTFIDRRQFAGRLARWKFNRTCWTNVSLGLGYVIVLDQPLPLALPRPCCLRPTRFLQLMLLRWKPWNFFALTSCFWSRDLLSATHEHTATQPPAPHRTAPKANDCRKTWFFFCHTVPIYTFCTLNYFVFRFTVEFYQQPRIVCAPFACICIFYYKALYIYVCTYIYLCMYAYNLLLLLLL